MKTRIPSRFVLLLAAAAMFAAISPTPARGDADADFRRNQNFQRINSDNFLNEIPAMDADHPSRPLADVFSLTPVSGQLILRTNLPSITPIGQARKLKIDSPDNWAIVNITDGATGSGPVVPTVFTLKENRFEPQHTDTLTIQEIRGAYININQRSQSAIGVKITGLVMQFANAAQHTPSICQLVVMRPVAGRPSPAQTWESTNFSSFMREHPVEADQYVRPLLREIGQDAALAADPMLAFEVFSDQWTPDSATTARITALVADLAAGDFHTRTHAEHQLADLGKDAAVVLMHLDRTKLTAEQTARIDKVLAPYQPVPAKDAEALRTDPAFLLSCLYSDDPIIRKVGLANLETATKLKLNFDPSANLATRNAAISPILQQLIDAKVIVATP